MNGRAAINILILLLLAAAATFVPGGGLTTLVVQQVVWIAVLVSFVFFFAYLYRERQHELWLLGDRHRALLYGAVALAVVLLAGRGYLSESTAGAIVLIVGFAAVVAALVIVVRYARANRAY